MSKLKNANRVTLIIYLWLKCLIFRSFLVELCKTLGRDGQEIKISTRMGKFYFWVKYTVFIKNENEFLKKIWFLLHLILWPYSISVPNFRTIWLIFYEIWQFKFISYWNNIFLYHFYTGLWESSTTSYRDRETNPSVKDLQSTTSRYYFSLVNHFQEFCIIQVKNPEK